MPTTISMAPSGDGPGAQRTLDRNTEHRVRTAVGQQRPDEDDQIVHRSFGDVDDAGRRC
jgi:hypothetical protein